MNSELQKETAGAYVLSKKYLAILKIFDKLPPRFKMLDAMREAGLKDGPQVRNAVAHVLRCDFKCLDVGEGPKRCWKKP